MERFYTFEGLFQLVCSLRKSTGYICLHLKVSRNISGFSPLNKSLNSTQSEPTTSSIEMHQTIESHPVGELFDTWFLLLYFNLPYPPQPPPFSYPCLHSYLAN